MLMLKNREKRKQEEIMKGNSHNVKVEKTVERTSQNSESLREKMNKYEPIKME